MDRVHRLTDCTVRIVTGESPPDELDGNVDVTIEFRSGMTYVAQFFSLENISSLMQRWEQSGECASGLYFWAKHAIIVRRLTDDVICETIQSLIASGEFVQLFAVTQSTDV